MSSQTELKSVLQDVLDAVKRVVDLIDWEIQHGEPSPNAYWDQCSFDDAWGRASALAEIRGLSRLTTHLDALNEAVRKMLIRSPDVMNPDLDVTLPWNSVMFRSGIYFCTSQIDRYSEVIPDEVPVEAETKTEPDDDAMLSLNSLMNFSDAPTQDALGKRLLRFRKKNKFDGSAWTERTEPENNQTKYLYRWGSVKDIVRKRRASADRPTD